MLSRLLLLGILGLSPVACPSDKKAASTDATPATQQDAYRTSMYRNLVTQDTLAVVTALGLEEPRLYQQWIQRSGFGRRRQMAALAVQHAPDVTEATMAAGAVVLAGTIHSNPWIAQLPESFPVTFDEEGFTLGEVHYADPSHAILLTHPNPLNPAFPLFLAAGNSDAAVRNVLTGQTQWGFDYQVVENGARIRLGRFQADEPYPWSIDSDQDYNLGADLVMVRQSSHVDLYAPLNSYSDAVLDSLSTALEASYVAITSLKPADQPVRSFEYRLYPSVQEKGVRTRNMQLSHTVFDPGIVHVIRAPGMHGDAQEPEKNLLLRWTLGQPQTIALEEGLAALEATAWHNGDPLNWAARLARAGLLPDLNTLLDSNAYSNVSPLLRTPAAAALVDWLMQEWGQETFLSRYATWNPDQGELATLTSRWIQHISRLGEKAALPDAPPMMAGMQKGFNFAHEGYGIVDGYGSIAAQHSLMKLETMGVNAVTVIPYSFMRNPRVPSRLNFMHGVGGENDEAVAHAGLAAQKLGFTAMLKPQIWIRGSWPGDIEMEDEAAWTQFQANYAEWIGHYAMLAEIYGFDSLCLGTELSKATMHDEEWWAELASRIRHIYSGPLTYASNWGEEFESLSFWEAFDYMGVDSYYPLSSKNDPSDRELRQGAEQVVAKIREVQKRFDMPLIITELGFASSEMPWKDPHLENRRWAVNPEHQARAYEAMLEALGQPDWLHGMYWWKWPSHLNRGGMEHIGFTPNGKPAADVITRYFNE